MARWHDAERLHGTSLWRARCGTAGCPMRGLVVWVGEDQEIVHLAASAALVHATTECVVDGAVQLVHTTHVRAGTLSSGRTTAAGPVHDPLHLVEGTDVVRLARLAAASIRAA